jgi:hypothetical protein
MRVCSPAAIGLSSSRLYQTYLSQSSTDVAVTSAEALHLSATQITVQLLMNKGGMIIPALAKSFFCLKHRSLAPTAQRSAKAQRGKLGALGTLTVFQIVIDVWQSERSSRLLKPAVCQLGS